MSNHPPTPDGPQASPRLDRGGWISGPGQDQAAVVDEFPGAAVARFSERFGDRWQLEGRADLGVYIAVQRPTPTAVHIIAAESIAELTAKVEAAESKS